MSDEINQLLSQINAVIQQDLRNNHLSGENLSRLADLSIMDLSVLKTIHGSDALLIEAMKLAASITSGSTADPTRPSNGPNS